MPVRPATLFRVAILLILAGHEFFMYCLARTTFPTVGFRPGISVIAGGFALAMLLPLIWAVALPELPEMYVRHVRARRWHRAGRCPACGYRLEGGVGARCAECGVVNRAPGGYRIGRRTIRTFLLLNLLAWLLGGVSGEVWLLRDEHAMRRDIAIQRGGVAGVGLTRQRVWPAQRSTLFELDGALAARP